MKFKTSDTELVDLIAKLQEKHGEEAVKAAFERARDSVVRTYEPEPYQADAISAVLVLELRKALGEKPTS